MHLLDFQRFPLARFSNSCHRYWRLPSPVFSSDFFQQFSGLLQNIQPDLIVPTCEELFWLRHSYSGPQLFCPQLPQLLEVHNKLTFVQLCQRLGLEVPSSFSVRRFSDVQQHEFACSPDARLPIVLKPAFSRFGFEQKLRPTWAEVQATLDGSRDWVCQTFLDGQSYCSYSIAHAGQLQAHACYRPLLRLSQGAAVAIEAVDHPQISRMDPQVRGPHQLDRPDRLRLHPAPRLPAQRYRMQSPLHQRNPPVSGPTSPTTGSSSGRPKRLAAQPALRHQSLPRISRPGGLGLATAQISPRRQSQPTPPSPKRRLPIQRHTAQPRPTGRIWRTRPHRPLPPPPPASPIHRRLRMQRDFSRATTHSSSRASTRRLNPDSGTQDSSPMSVQNDHPVSTEPNQPGQPDSFRNLGSSAQPWLGSRTQPQ